MSANGGAFTPRLEDALPAPSMLRDHLHAVLESMHQRNAPPPFPPEFFPSARRLQWLGRFSHFPLLVPAGDLAPKGPVLLLLPARRDDIAEQLWLREILPSVPEPGSHAVCATGPRGPVKRAIWRSVGDETSRRAATDFLLTSGLLPGAHHRALTSEENLRLEELDDEGPWRDHRRARLAWERLRNPFVSTLDALDRSLEPVAQRVFGVELWALERNRAALASGEIDAADYFKRLSTAPGSGVPRPNMRRLLEALAMEDGLDFAKTTRERDGLIGALDARLSLEEHDELIAAASDHGVGLMTPFEFAQYLFQLAKQRGIPESASPAFRQFSRYAQIVESLDLEALLLEMRSLEASVFGAHTIAKSQGNLLALTEDILRMKRLAANPEFTTSEDRDIFLSLDARAQAIAESVGLTLPHPNPPLADFFPPLEETARTLRARAPSLVRKALKDRDKDEIVPLTFEPALLPALEETCRREKAAWVALSPLSKALARNASWAHPSTLIQNKEPAARVFTQLGLFSAEEDADPLKAAAPVYGALLAIPRVTPVDKDAAPRLPWEDEDYRRATGVRVRVDLRVPWQKGWEVRTTIRLPRSAPVRTRWRFLPAQKGAKVRAPAEYAFLGTVGMHGIPQLLWARVEPGPSGHLQWFRRQWIAVKSATRNFFEMQKRTTFLAGVWIAGGLGLSLFAGVVSTVFIALWLAIGLVVLVGVVIFGRDSSARAEWAEGLKTIRQKRRAFLQRVLPFRFSIDEDDR